LPAVNADDMAATFVTRRLGDWLHYQFQALDYGVLVPAVARLPIAAGRAVADIRGCVNAVFDLDWRSLSLRRAYVRRATYRAMQELVPGGGSFRWRIQTLRRFLYMAREEWMSALCDGDSMAFLQPRTKVHGIDALVAAQRSGRGVVLLGAHFGNLPGGMVVLGLNGLKVNFLTSAIVEDDRVHPAVRDFYRRKYRGIERFLNGGRVLHYQRHLKSLYRALERGELVIVLGDLQASGRRSFDTEFLGAVRRMAPGALRMASKTGSLMSAYVHYFERGGRYGLRCAPVQDPHGDDFRPEALYHFLETQIRQRPEQWWAADLLPGYGRAERAREVERER